MSNVQEILSAQPSVAFRRARIKTRLINPLDAVWDFRLGIDSFGYLPAIGEPGSPVLRLHYTPTPYDLFFRILRKLEAGHDDVMVDLGCGMGRTVFASAWFGLRRAIGVEVAEELHEQAILNRARSRLDPAKIDFLRVSAEDFVDHEATIIFMFNPFGPGTMSRVMNNLAHSLQVRPRNLRIAYLNPVHAKVLDECPALQRMDEWPARRTFRRNAKYAVAFWRSRLAPE